MSVSTSNNRPYQRQKVLEIRLIVWIDVVDVDTAVSVILEVPDDFVRISLAPVARRARGIGDTAQGSTIVVRACRTLC
jgi:hypothetical protein